MVRAWPSLVGRAQLSTRLLGEVTLTALLAVTLAFLWSDGVPTDQNVDSAWTAPSGIALLQVSANNLSGKPGWAPVQPVIAPALPPPDPTIPTAAPVQLLIPALDVHRAVEKVGFDSSGAMKVPVNSWNAGWFEYGPVPGAPGDAVIEGHAGYPGQPVIFGRLYTLRPGDRIVVVLADKSRRLFIVVSKHNALAGTAPAGLADPYGPPRLTLITCTGTWDKQNYTYSERLLVEARYVGLA
jgi:hypothetical protein